MARLFISPIVLFFHFSHAQQNIIYSARHIQISPNFNTKFELTSYDTNYLYLFSYKDIRMYKFKQEKEIIVNFQSQGITFSEKIFIHHKDSVYGYLSDYPAGKLDVRQHIDTATYLRGIFNSSIEKDFKTLHTVLISKHAEKDSCYFSELFEVSDYKDPDYTSRWKLTYSKIPTKHPFSLSPYMDSLKSSKLIEIKSENPSKFLKEKKLRVDSFVFMNRLENYNDFDEERVFSFFKSYEQKNRKE